MGIDELRKMTEAGEISVSVKAPCTCTETEHPGWSIDECWEQPYATKVPYERTEGDGLIVCGWCDGDLWVWRHAPNVVPDLLGQIDRLRDQPRLPDLDSCPCGLGVAADPVQAMRQNVQYLDALPDTAMPGDPPTTNESNNG